jgi:hypothetical protein
VVWPNTSTGPSFSSPIKIGEDFPTASFLTNPQHGWTQQVVQSEAP